MEEWAQAVSDGVLTHVADNTVSVHSPYFCGAAIRISAGLVLIHTANATLAAKAFAVIQRWDDVRARDRRLRATRSQSEEAP